MLGSQNLDINGNERVAKECYLKAGELGLGEGYSRIAYLHAGKREFDEARRYYEMAIDKKHVVAIYTMAVRAKLGYFHFDNALPQDERQEPDLEEEFRLFQEGAQLGDAKCCLQVGICFLNGEGTEENLDKGFKWIRTSAEKGYLDGMRMCGYCYWEGEGVEQSNEQAIYWYEKFLELKDDDEIRNHVRYLQNL